MSKEQIVNYVMNTPGNTNRIILEQMIDAESKDTVEMATTATLRKLGVDIKPSKIIFSEQLESGNLQTEKNIDIVAGEKYTIFLTDGKEKYILATSVVAKVTDGIAWFGNLSLIFGDEEENTGESYVVISTPTEGSIIITGTSSNETLAIEREETIHPIDPKFLTTTINLDEYGIDLMSMFAAGGGNQFFEATGFWEKINEADGNVQFLTNVGVKNFLIPSLKTYDSNMTFAWCVFGCSLMTSVEGQLVKADILFSYSASGVSVTLKLA